ncbi:hypothetical protein [Arthrobacter sp. JCM 19049]|uniref:hypothetical protein n=1 Tax=Arthrobacter sp. JCM 19049 TaxID=1460643 RepID=UPI0006D0B548|nr:hypothetical protein [Arthrobacter sp. JCM 19049]
MQALRLSWRRTSLRTKLVMLMCGLMILGVIATAVGSAQSLRISLTKQIDDQLLAAGPTLSYGLNQAYRYAWTGTATRNSKPGWTPPCWG